MFVLIILILIYDLVLLFTFKMFTNSWQNRGAVLVFVMTSEMELKAVVCFHRLWFIGSTCNVTTPLTSEAIEG